MGLSSWKYTSSTDSLFALHCLPLCTTPAVDVNAVLINSILGSTEEIDGNTQKSSSILTCMSKFKTVAENVSLLIQEKEFNTYRIY